MEILLCLRVAYACLVSLLLVHINRSRWRVRKLPPVIIIWLTCAVSAAGNWSGRPECVTGSRWRTARSFVTEWLENRGRGEVSATDQGNVRSSIGASSTSGEWAAVWKRTSPIVARDIKILYATNTLRNCARQLIVVQVAVERIRTNGSSIKEKS